ncbi:MAG: hypothetical protein OXG88_03770 [Gammaproteobacteria bacterium]|nr:hypothetical protein [Gammaproteobacteria bacterium]
MMTFYIFAGDMLIMFFMAALVVWMFWKTPDKSIKESAEIPLKDEVRHD